MSFELCSRFKGTWWLHQTTTGSGGSTGLD